MAYSIVDTHATTGVTGSGHVLKVSETYAIHHHLSGQTHGIDISGGGLVVNDLGSSGLYLYEVMPADPRRWHNSAYVVMERVYSGPPSTWDNYEYHLRVMTTGVGSVTFGSRTSGLVAAILSEEGGSADEIVPVAFVTTAKNTGYVLMRCDRTSSPDHNFYRASFVVNGTGVMLGPWAVVHTVNNTQTAGYFPKYWLSHAVPLSNGQAVQFWTAEEYDPNYIFSHLGVANVSSIGTNSYLAPDFQTFLYETWREDGELDLFHRATWLTSGICLAPFTQYNPNVAPDYYQNGYRAIRSLSAVGPEFGKSEGIPAVNTFAPGGWFRVFGMGADKLACLFRAPAAGGYATRLVFTELNVDVNTLRITTNGMSDAIVLESTNCYPVAVLAMQKNDQALCYAQKNDTNTGVFYLIDELFGESDVTTGRFYYGVNQLTKINTDPGVSSVEIGGLARGGRNLYVGSRNWPADLAAVVRSEAPFDRWEDLTANLGNDSIRAFSTTPWGDIFEQSDGGKDPAGYRGGPNGTGKCD